MYTFFAYVNLSAISQWLKKEDHVFPRYCRLSDNAPCCKNRLSQFEFLFSETPKQAVGFALCCPPEFGIKALLLQTLGSHLFLEEYEIKF